ncbi:MAG: 3-dehydroquinate synthase [Saprospiraceae bacterium]|nr:3-dehydroquinate synthase [Saprospiraceae bacterium]
MEIIKLSDYNIYVGENSWETLQKYVANYSKIFVIVDENTQRDCLPILKSNLPNINWNVILIPSGEVNKNIETCQIIWQTMMTNEANRNALTINLGGGVIGDMGGFCASTFKRGMDFIQIPTTLLSQVDASIGGKLGIDFQNIKNSIGLFANPKSVFVNPIFLKTLSQREIRSGFAEILKHALIVNVEQWDVLKTITDLTKVNWSERLMPSLNIKKEVVEMDPFEKGWRKSLNFGHTIGHAIESLLLETENRLLHGEAIAIGMICESYLSHKILEMSKADLDEICQYILAIYGKNDLFNLDKNDLLNLMKQDKKNDANVINFTLLNRIGDANVNQTTNEKLITESLNFYNDLRV